MKKVTLLILAFLIALVATQAQSWIQIGGDIDGEAAGDNSGYSVSLNADGSVIAIGADGNDGNGSFAGHVRVYENQGGTWIQIGDDIDGETVDNHSGYSVCLNGDGSVVAIGAPDNHDNGVWAGQVRVYENQGGTWIQIGNDIDGEAAYDHSGRSVSLSSDGSYVAIGAPGNDGNGGDAGHVRIYENQNSIWTQIGDDIDGEALFDQSGTSVCLNSDGNKVAIGAKGNNSATGSVRVYENQGAAWMQIGTDIDGESMGDIFGSSVSLNANGSVVAVGGWNNDGNGVAAGHVRIYNGTWSQIGADIDGEAEGDHSGFSIDISADGSIVAIGAINNAGNGTNSGHVRIYENQGGSWIQLGNDIDGESLGNKSGYSVSISADGTVVAIGAISNSDNGAAAGHVRIFQFDPTLNVGDALHETNMLIYPNPTSGKLEFKYTDINIHQITVTDLTGKQIFHKRDINPNEAIDLSEIESGIYLITIQTDDDLFSSKILKE